MHRHTTTNSALLFLPLVFFTLLGLIASTNFVHGKSRSTIEDNPQPTSAPTPPIDVSEVFVLAETDEKTVSSLVSDALASDTKTPLPENIEEKIEQNFKKIEKMHQQHVLTLNFLNQAIAEWKNYLGQIEAYFQYLAGSLKKIESAKLEISALREKWLASADAYQKMGLTSAHQKATEMVAMFDKNLEALEKVGKERLSEQEKISAQKASLENHIKYLLERRDLIAMSKWQQDKPSIMSKDFYSSFKEFGAASVRKQWREYWDDARDYYQSVQKKTALELIVLLLLWGYLRTSFKKITEKEEMKESEELKAVLRHSFMISLFLVALIANLWHKSEPLLVKETINLFIFLPIVVFLLELIKEKQLKLFLWGMALTYLGGIVRTLFMGFTPWDRLLAILHICLGLTVVVVFYPSGESARLIFGNGRALKWSRRGRTVLWGIFAAALLMQLGGYHTGSILLADGAFGSTYLSLGILAAYRLFKSFISISASGATLQRFRIFSAQNEVIISTTNFWLKRIAFLLWIYFLLKIWNLDEKAGKILSKVGEAGFGYGENRFNLEKLFLAIIAIYLSILTAKIIKFVLQEEIYPKKNVQESVRGIITQTVKYLVVLIGFLTALSILGIKLQNITILASAFGVGIGFGLQNIINNFVSGVILFIERPIKAGDLITLDGTWGLVKKIGIRTTIMEGWDKSEVIIPNSEILSGKLTNWSLSSPQVGTGIPVEVAYGSDPRQVTELLVKTALNHPEVLKDPPPAAFFLGFGESALQFELRFFADFLKRFKVASELRTSIYEELNKAGIEIPFPQRDIHIKSIPTTSEPQK